MRTGTFLSKLYYSKLLVILLRKLVEKEAPTPAGPFHSAKIKKKRSRSPLASVSYLVASRHLCLRHRFKRPESADNAHSPEASEGKMKE